MTSMASRIGHATVKSAPSPHVPPRPMKPAAGHALEAPLQADMGRRFGHDFSHVRVHTGGAAAASAASLGALAYTVGSDIAFAPGRYAPASPGGRHLLAHELAHVVQQRGSAGHPQAKLAASTPGDASERQADAAADAVMSGQAVPALAPTALQLARQESAAPVATTARRIDGSAATVSWIDPASPAGARVPDAAPPATVTAAFLTGNSGFRFSNYLHAWCETSDGVHLSGSDFHADSGIYRGPSFLGIASRAFATQQSKSSFNEGGVEGAEFTQVTGARTISAGVIGGGVGATVGVGAGAWLGAKAGAAGGTFFGGPVGTVIGGIGGAIVGGLLGYAAGSAVANRATNFPPIWTRLKLRLKADGTRTTTLVGHSHFPSNSHYLDLSRVAVYSALGPEQTRWEGGGWDAGNPWGIARPLVGP